MNVTLSPFPLEGNIQAIASKSHAHRLLLCAALSEGETLLFCRAPSEDIFATARCLAALGAKIAFERDVFSIRPLDRAHLPERPLLDCGESGTTYRLLAPLSAALGVNARFQLAGRLPERPMDSLFEALERHGVTVEGKGTASPSLSGRLQTGDYEIPGDVSSQFVSGLLMALPCLGQESRVCLKGGLVSKGYVDLTLGALADFSVRIASEEDGFTVPGGGRFRSPGSVTAEGDWSNAAFWLCAGAVGGRGVSVFGLNPASLQGDKAVLRILKEFGAEVKIEGDTASVRRGILKGIAVDAAPIPDLAPALAAVAAAATGATVLENAGRLRLKESDRLSAICRVIQNLGGKAEAEENRLIIYGTGRLLGGQVPSHGDHRIAMMAAVMAGICEGDVTIKNARAVEKSYPAFFADFAALGGRVTKENE